VGLRERLTRQRPLPRPVRWGLSILAAVGLFQTVIGLPSMSDDLARWPGIFATIGDGLRSVQNALAPYSGDVARYGVLVGAVALLVWLNLPVQRGSIEVVRSPDPTREPAAPVRDADRVSVNRLVWDEPEPAKPTPKASGEELRKRAAQAGTTLATQVRREMKANPAPLHRRAVVLPPPPPPALPQRLSGLSGGLLGTYGWRMLTDRRQLQDEGRSHQSQLNRNGSLVASDEKGWRKRIGLWEAKVVAWSDEWGWAPEAEVRRSFDDGEAAVDPTTRPRPEWRAKVSGRIDGGLGWLEAHYVTVEQLGLHTE
jgi:hypothetical protein